MSWEEEIYKVSKGKVTPENYNEFNVAFYQAFIDQVASEYPSEGNVGNVILGVVKIWGMKLNVESTFEYIDENEGTETQPTNTILVEEERVKVEYLGIETDYHNGCYVVRFEKGGQVKEAFFQGSEGLVQAVYSADWQNNLCSDSNDDLLEKADQYFETEKEFWFENMTEIVD